MYQILSLDDARVTRTMVQISLKDKNLQVDTVETPEEALDMIAQKRYDLLIVDYMMPSMTGIDFMKNVRQTCDYKTTPFFMLTAEDGEHLKEAAKSLDAKAWINKPFTPQELKSLVYSILEPTQD